MHGNRTAFGSGFRPRICRSSRRNADPVVRSLSVVKALSNFPKWLPPARNFCRPVCPEPEPEANPNHRHIPAFPVPSSFRLLELGSFELWFRKHGTAVSDLGLEFPGLPRPPSAYQSSRVLISCQPGHGVLHKPSGCTGWKFNSSGSRTWPSVAAGS